MTNVGSGPTKFILKGTPEELESFTAKKLLLIAANYTNIPIVCETATPEECKKLSPLAKSLVLLIVSQYSQDGGEEAVAVATSRTMMKTIATLGGKTVPSIVHEAVVDGWLSFIWKSIDLPFQAALLLLQEENASDVEKEDIEEDLKKALKKIERHLSKQESILSVSENKRPLSIVPGKRTLKAETNYSFADWSLAATLHYMSEKKIALSAMSSEENPHLFSWKKNIDTKLVLGSANPGR